jgi:hypothetical protein
LCHFFILAFGLLNEKLLFQGIALVVPIYKKQLFVLGSLKKEGVLSPFYVDCSPNFGVFMMFGNKNSKIWRYS